jgi:hypothetical protein
MLDEWGLEGKNMVSLGIDGAASMVGKNNSLY